MRGRPSLATTSRFLKIVTLQIIVLGPPHLAGVEPEGLHEDAVLAHVQRHEGELTAEFLGDLAQNKSRDLNQSQPCYVLTWE